MRILILGICSMLTALVFATMFVVIWKSRRSGDVGASFHRSAAVEVVWAVIPCAMFVACALPAVRLIVASAATVNQSESRESRAPAGWLPQGQARILLNTGLDSLKSRFGVVK